MSFKDNDQPWTQLDENLDDLAYVEVTEKTDTPEKAVAWLFQDEGGILDLHDQTGPNPSPSYNVGYPDRAKVTGLDVTLDPTTMGDSPIWVSRLIRTEAAPAFWRIDISEALVAR